MAGSLGVSSLVCLLNNGDDGSAETSQSLLGPVLAVPFAARGKRRLDRALADAGRTAAGHRPRGRSAGAPIEGAEVDVWHASPVGFYENQDPTRPT